MCLSVWQRDRVREKGSKRKLCAHDERGGQRSSMLWSVLKRGSCAIVNEACSRKPTVWARCRCVSVSVFLRDWSRECVFQCEWGELPSVQPCLTLSHACHLETMGRWWKQGHWESFYFFLIRWGRLSLNQITGADLQHAANKLPFSLSIAVFLLPFICFYLVTPPLRLH